MSKQVADRQRSSRAVVDAIVQHRNVIAEAQGKLLGPAAARLGKPIPDIATLLEMYADTLAHDTQSLTKAADAHALEGTDDGAPRDRRDLAEAALRAHLGPLRRTISGVYGDPGLQALGLWESAPSSVDQLRNYATLVLDALPTRGPTLKPLPSAAGMSFDPLPNAATLKPLVKELDEALSEVSKEAAELQSTLIAKNEAMAINDQDFIGIAGIVERLAAAAGLSEVASRIRPSVANPGVLVEVPTEEQLAKPPAANDPAPSPAKPIRPNFPGADPLDPEEPEEK